MNYKLHLSEYSSGFDDIFYQFKITLSGVRKYVVKICGINGFS